MDGLSCQSFDAADFEVVIVDNGSSPALADASLPVTSRHLGIRVIYEPRAGLTPARLAGISAARNSLLIFVDDDNVLAPQYLEVAANEFAANENLVAAGGPIEPEFESTPPSWLHEFYDLLALRDVGPTKQIVRGGAGKEWPSIAPVGAGLCIRLAAAKEYAELVKNSPTRITLDRRAGQLTSGGDNDMVFTAMHGGGDIAHLPQLRLTHLIPSGRLRPDYLGRLNRDVQRSWVAVLNIHGFCPWPWIPRWSVPMRSVRLWVRTRAWKSPAHSIRYHGLVGRLHGQADLQP